MRYISKVGFYESLVADGMCRVVDHADNADHKTIRVVGAGDALDTENGQRFVSLIRAMYEQVGKAHFVNAPRPNGELAAIANSVYAFRRYFLDWYLHYKWIDREKYETLKENISVEALNAGQ